MPEERLNPLYSLDSHAVLYHLLPPSLMHRFRGPSGPSTGAPSPRAALPQTPPPERIEGPQTGPPPKKGKKKKGKAKGKKKKNKKGLKEGPQSRDPPASSALPTLESYWGPVYGNPNSCEAPEEDESSACEQEACELAGVRCVDASRSCWLPESKISFLLRGVAGGLRCLSLAGCNVGEDAQRTLGECRR